MAHHQHHGADYDAQVSRTLASRPSATTLLPAISEDEQAAEADEPPDYEPQHFTKTRPPPGVRRQSLLSRAFHTDSESHDEDLEHFEPIGINREHSISSTASTFSNRSFPDFTSDDGHNSTGTRASTPSSPRTLAAYMNPALGSFKPAPRLQVNGHEEATAKPALPESASTLSEPAVEAGLGRKRCITFACTGGKGVEQVKPAVKPEEKPAEPPKRPCALKFLCPSRESAERGPGQAGPTRTSRRLSPAPPAANSSASPKPASKRSHRDSDVTIRLGSPKLTRRRSPSRGRRLNQDDDLEHGTTSFHEFASSEEEVEDWVQESTCHRSRLTVNDTLKKENDIRQLAEEAEEEDEIDGVAGADDYDLEEDENNSPDELLSDNDVSDTGFQTDDEEGFADSDDDSDCESDYEWWAPRKSLAASPFVASDIFRPRPSRTGSDSSLNSDFSPKRRQITVNKAKGTRPVDIRPTTPDLPDSTDFVCGTLDEDRPVEQAFFSQVEQRKAAKHRTIPQDIDPTFPTSDPELESDEEDEAEEDVHGGAVEESDQNAFIHGKFEPSESSMPRGRRPNPSEWRSPHRSPMRLKTPPLPTKRIGGKSPCPRGLFSHSPKRVHSPAPRGRLHSPPPSPRASAPGSLNRNEAEMSQAFLGHGALAPVFTASLPKSPAPFIKRSRAAAAAALECDSDEDEGEETPNEATYKRSAIDIVQGLEQKRLRRRQRFYERYCKHAGKKDKGKREKRPLPGKGAERMRQVGLECAVYRGKRVLSI